VARKIAQSTCTQCHGIFPRTEMKQVTIEEDSGSSFGLSTNPSPKRKNSTRLSARNYKRKRKVWVCNECLSKKSGSGIIKGFFKLLFFIVIAGIIYSVFTGN